MNEYIGFQKNYPNIVFSGDGQQPDKNKYLFLLDGYTVYPWSYNPEYWKQFKGIITWNSKLVEMYKNQFNMTLCNGFPCFNNYYQLTSFIPVENKLNGVILSCRHRENSGIVGDIAYRRLQIMQNISQDNRLISHCYGRWSYGGNLYQGVIGQMGTEDTCPSSLSKLQTMNKYKFALCLENCYHSVYSYGWLTEKLLDAMKSKIIGIYMGAYNIQDIVPNGLYVDYRQFKTDKELVDRLLNISMSEYRDITEKAYQWQEQTEWGKINKLQQILNNLP